MNFKTLLFALGLVTIFSIAKSQVVPNANMEVWVHTGNNQNPQGWSTPNSIIATAPVCFKDSLTPHSGNYAAKLTANTFFGVTIPGLMGTGTILVDLQTQSASFTGGFALTDSAVEALIGYFKFTPVGNDSALFFAILTKWNTGTNERDTVAIAYDVQGSTPAWTLFSTPFNVLIPGETPDSAQIIFATTNNYSTAQVGSTLWIDDVDFTNAVGVEELPEESVTSFPNPANNYLLVSLPGRLDAKDMLVSDILGRTVFNQDVTPEININTAHYAEGVYVLTAKNAEGQIVARGKFTVKH